MAVVLFACSGAVTTVTHVAVVIASILPPQIAIGGNAQATATLQDSAGNSLSGRTVVWSTSSATIATVDANTGVVRGIAAGTATITAMSEGKAGRVDITVTAPAPPTATVATVLVSLGSSTITVGSTTVASASPLDSASRVLTGRSISWSSSNEAVAKVDAGTGVVTAVSVGSASIIATCEGKTGSATITVRAIPVATVSVSLALSSITVGASTQATAALKDASGNPLTGRAISWSSSNPAVATVSSTGVVTAVSVGNSNIVATSEGITGQATLTVTLVPVASVSVSLGAASLTAGQTTQATAVLKDAGGNVLTGRTVAWTSANSAVATVNASGLVTAVAAGTADITATSEGKSGKATLTVTAPAPVATKLAIVRQPSSTATSGQPLAQQPVLQLQDVSSAAVSQAGVVVTAAVASGGGTLSGATTATTTAAGTATFTTLAITGSGAQTLRFTAPNLAAATSAPITVTGSGPGGTVLFTENFEDTNFGARGWYDVGGMTSLSTTDHITGSGHSLQVSFPQGALKPSPNVNARHLFTPSDAVYVRYWIKHSTNWVGSGHNYHPHEFYLLSTLDDQFAGPSFNYLTTYIEDNWMSDGGHPLLQAQDAQNIDVTRINQDLTSVTENRAVSGCNGNPDNTAEISCYQSGSQWNNVKVWRAAQPAFVDAAGPTYKGDWHKVEAYYQLNSIVNGIGQRDGVAQYWVDGVLYIDRHDLMFRTGAHPTLQFNQFIMAPYIGDGSPVAQSLWYDDLVVMTAPPSP